MSDEIIKIPDIGGGEAEVIEICVKPGDTVSAEDSLIVLESDKASMEVPAPRDGVVTEVLLTVGSNISEGDPMVKMAAAGTTTTAPEVVEQPEPKKAPVVAAPIAPTAPVPPTEPHIEKVTVPDIGAEHVPVIEISVSVGDQIEKEASLIVLESDKASMEVPSPFAGIVKAIMVKEGDTFVKAT